MKVLLTLVVLFAACTSRTYSEPKVGMEYVDFMRLCGNAAADDTRTFTNSQGSVVTIVLKSDGEGVVWLDNTNANRSDRMCWGKFTFVNNKLESIGR